MSRPLRIEYENAWYHVMNRGRRRETVFSEEADYLDFIELLKESTTMWGVKIAAYCLIPNHYHLLIQTPNANLSRCMRHVNGVYTQQYNRRHNTDGPLFRGRYKAILIDADTYLLELVRYIHKNPIRASLVNELSQYPWSSHRGLISDSREWMWLDKDSVLTMFSDDKDRNRKEYVKFVSMDDSEEINRLFARTNLPAVLGSNRFISWVKDRFYREKLHPEVSESRSLAPGIEEIIVEVCSIYRIEKEALYVSRRRYFNEPRNVAIYLARKLSGKPLLEIAQKFKMNSYSAVSHVVNRVKDSIERDPDLLKKVEMVKSQLNKSQFKT